MNSSQPTPRPCYVINERGNFVRKDGWFVPHSSTLGGFNANKALIQLFPSPEAAAAATAHHSPRAREQLRYIPAGQILNYLQAKEEVRRLQGEIDRARSRASSEQRKRKAERRAQASLLARRRYLLEGKRRKKKGPTTYYTGFETARRTH